MSIKISLLLQGLLLVLLFLALCPLVTRPGDPSSKHKNQQNPSSKMQMNLNVPILNSFQDYGKKLIILKVFCLIS